MIKHNTFGHSDFPSMGHARSCTSTITIASNMLNLCFQDEPAFGTNQQERRCTFKLAQRR